MPAGGEFARRVYGVAALRGTRLAGGRLKQIELLNAGDLGTLGRSHSFVDLQAESEVEIVQQHEGGSVHIYC
ncbi:hypothetical protein GY45DRAFT_1029084 [Cubamyces sp. BRFM 1775]|nr:hypothetical protein GY45DRAFT_1029084 [Cubamyces sp. BRFM 1775]